MSKVRLENKWTCICHIRWVPLTSKPPSGVGLGYGLCLYNAWGKQFGPDTWNAAFSVALSILSSLISSVVPPDPCLPLLAILDCLLDLSNVVYTTVSFLLFQTPWNKPHWLSSIMWDGAHVTFTVTPWGIIIHTSEMRIHSQHNLAFSIQQWRDWVPLTLRPTLFGEITSVWLFSLWFSS